MSSLSDPVLIATIAAVSSAVTGVIGLIAIILNGRASKQRNLVTNAKVDSVDSKAVGIKEESIKTQSMVNFVDSKTDALRATAHEIHVATNGTLAQANEAITVAAETIKGMRLLIENMEAAKVVTDRVSKVRQKKTRQP